MGSTRTTALLASGLLLVSGDGAAVGDAEIVAELDRLYQAAVEANDAAAIERLLADDFALVTGRGRVYTKEDLVAEARSQVMRYVTQEDSQRQVRVWGDTAVVTALLTVKGTKDGVPFDYRQWFSDVYLRRERGWIYVFAQASLALPENP